MGSVKWLDEAQGVILLRFDDSDSMDQILADYAQFAAMITSAPSKTYTIVDFLELKSMPGHAISRFPQFARLTPPKNRSEVIALVSQRSFITMVTEIFAKVYPDFRDRFVYFSTVQEAQAFIEQRIREAAG